MASPRSHHLSFFFLSLLLLLLSPQTQAREGKFFSFFTHFTSHSKQPQVVVVPIKPKSHPPSPSPAPAPAPSPAESAITPSPAESVVATSPAESIVAAPVPAPESSEFVDRGDGYGLYGTTSFENKESKSFKTGYPKTRLYSNYNNNDDEVYRNSNYNSQEYRSYRSNNYYSNNVNEDSFYSNNNNNDRYSYNNNNNKYYSNNNNEYERKREGMSDTRFVEGGKYYYDVKGENEKYNYKVDGYEPAGRGSTTVNNNGGIYHQKNYSKYPNEFDTMEEYEKQQESQGYEP